MFKKFLFAIGGFVLVVLSLGAVKVAQIKTLMSQPHAMPASAVTSTEATLATWTPTLEAIATLAAVEGTMIAADAEGAVTRIAVENGARVKTGDVILELDSSVEKAQLAAAEARLGIARLDFQRAEGLLRENTISQAELDAASAQAKQAEADVEALKATIAKKVVRAPFDGRVGIRLVNTGQFVGRGEALIPLQQLERMYVNFNIPQRQLPQLQVGQTVRVRVDAFPDRDFEARVNAISPAVDESSRNVAVQALIENRDELLRPGMFARASVVLPEGQPTVVLPQTAIAFASYGNSVYIIEKMKGQDGQEYLGVRQQFVRLGPTRGDQIAILEGVKPGEQVVTTGVFKLRNGAAVQVNNEVTPSNNPNPTPVNT